MADGAEGLARAAARVATRFGERFAALATLAIDRSRADELALEAAPVAEALLFGLAAADAPVRDAGELREAFALASLLGRRAAVLGVTPSGALSLVRALLDATEAEAQDGRRLTPDQRERLAQDLRAVVLEGYVAAREEKLEEHAARRAAEAIAIVDVAPRCVAVIVTGTQSAAEIERVLDDVGRRLLAKDARACLFHVQGLRGADRERAVQLFAAHVTCTMLGVHCVFSGVGEDWLEAAQEADVDLSDVRFADTFHDGLSAVLGVAGLTVPDVGGLGGVLRRLTGRSKKVS